LNPSTTTGRCQSGPYERHRQLGIDKSRLVTRLSALTPVTLENTLSVLCDFFEEQLETEDAGINVEAGAGKQNLVYWLALASSSTFGSPHLSRHKLKPLKCTHRGGAPPGSPKLWILNAIRPLTSVGSSVHHVLTMASLRTIAVDHFSAR
jgi:hypothetical protein